MQRWQWVLLLGGTAAGLLLVYRRSCIRCQSLARNGDFQQIVAEYEKVCEACVDEGIANSTQALSRKLDTATEEELADYWHNLFVMGQRAGSAKKVGQNLIDLTAARDPVLEQYRARGYTTTLEEGL